MTPPDNSRQDGSGANTDTGDTGTSAVPPWQRIDEDGTPSGDSAAGSAATAGSDGTSGDGDVAATQQAAGTDPAQTPQGSDGAGETAMFSGAANRLFGPHNDADPTRPVQAPQGAATQFHGPSGAQSNSQSHPVSALRRPGRGPRRANLQIKRFDPWSVLKLSLVLGVALFFIWLVAVGVLYTVLDGMGVWDNINGTYTSLVQGEGSGGGEPLITAGTVFGVAAIVGAVNIVLISALTTVGAFIYNVCADLSGGLEVTLSERE